MLIGIVFAVAAIVFAVAAALMFFLTSPPPPGVTFDGTFSLENVESGSTVITIKHTFGDRALDVIESSGGAPRWKNLEVRLNGMIVHPSPRTVMISEGTKVSWRTAGTHSMVVGDLIYLPVGKPLMVGDVLSLRWVPKNRILLEKTVMH